MCDSDTKLDSLATVELCKVLESNTKYGAVGGDVMILNMQDSYISFMSSLRYWMAFNIERSCQSFFNCVSCISGPLGNTHFVTVTKQVKDATPVRARIFICALVFFLP